MNTLAIIAHAVISLYFNSVIRAQILTHTSDPYSDSKHCQLIGRQHVLQFQSLEKEKMAGHDCVAANTEEIRKFDEAELVKWLEENDIPPELWETVK